jgi:hypothetical protein
MFRSWRPSTGSSYLGPAKVTIVQIFGKTRRYKRCSGVAACCHTTAQFIYNGEGMDWIDLAQGQVVISCEHVNEPPRFLIIQGIPG